MENNLENNKLIAEFMGATPCILSIKSIGDMQGYECDDFKLPIDELEYATSWDWLMPVVQKCATTYIDKHKFVRELRLFNMVIYSDIQEIYKEVVEYVKWFNTQDRVSLS